MESVKSPTAAALPSAAQSLAPAKAVVKPAVTYESESIRELKAHATHIRHGETIGEQNGMKRLNQALTSGQDLRRDVPRGFYLNISV